MAMNSTVSTPIRWIMRSVGYALAMVFMIMPMYRMGNTFKTVELAAECQTDAEYKGVKQSGLFFAQRYSLCMFLKADFLSAKNQEQALLDVMSLPNAPCSRVGIWKTRRGNLFYRISMFDNGRFEAEPTGAVGYSNNNSGFWGENGGRMIWIYDSMFVWPPDINKMDKETATGFTLTEVNGAHTEFTREGSVDSERCHTLAST